MVGTAQATRPASNQRQMQQQNDQHDDMEADDLISHVNYLQKHGINAADITKLIEAGITTTGMVLKVPSKILLAIKGFSEAKVEKIRTAAKKLDSGPGSVFITGTQVRERRRRCIRITTGAKAVDTILGGGIETGSITEVYGEFRSGKTQLAHTLAVTSQLGFDLGGGQGKAVFVDTEGNFRPERIEKIADRFGLDADETLSNIIVGRAYSHDQQMELLKPLAAMIAEHGPFRLVIIDSVIALFRVEFSGRGELAERQQKLGQYLAELTRIAEEFNVAVFLVNQVTADPGAISMFGPVMKPVGGNVLAHASATRIFLKKGREDQRIAKIVDSPTQPEADAAFRLTDGGVDDAS